MKRLLIAITLITAWPVWAALPSLKPVLATIKDLHTQQDALNKLSATMATEVKSFKGGVDESIKAFMKEGATRDEIRKSLSGIETAIEKRKKEIEKEIEATMRSKATRKAGDK